MNIAVIDLGTNTFHILIAQQNVDGLPNFVFRKRQYVQLAESGIERIGTAAMQRAKETLTLFQTIMEEYQVTKVKAFGTAALRTASNGHELVDFAQKQLNISIEIIPGKEEARLIHLGTMQAIPAPKGNVLIMDIGGGSVEYILANKDEVLWAGSFPVGIAVLFKNFHENDPVAETELSAINTHLDTLLAPMIEAVKSNERPMLVGAAGAFEVLEDILVNEKPSPTYSNFSADAFLHLYRQLIYTAQEERRQIPKIPATRIEMIIVALQLIYWTIKTLDIQEVSVSAFAMKEGILSEMNDT